MKKTRKFKFISLEGGEGSGKSSILEALKKEFGDTIHTTREPGGSPFGEVIREAALKHPLAGSSEPETMLCLMFASRFDHVARTIVSALKRKKHVVTDRFDASSYAYNVWAQTGGKLEDVFWGLRNELTVIPDLYIYIDVDPKEGIRRAASRNKNSTEGNHFDRRKLDFHKKVKKGYERFLKKVPHFVIDANRPLNRVIEDVISIFRKYIHTTN